MLPWGLAAQPQTPHRGEDTYLSFRSASLATVRYDDCIVSGTGTAPVAVRVSALIEGGDASTKVVYDTSSTGPYDLTSTAEVTLSMGVNGKPVIPDSTVGQENAYDGATVVRSGVLSDFIGREVFASDVFMVTPNKPFSLSLGISTLADVGYNNRVAGLVRSEVNFGNTYSFATDRPTDRPVFDLPEGYTMNSVSAHIVDNRFNPVPEPTSLAALGLGGLAMLRRRRKA